MMKQKKSYKKKRTKSMMIKIIIITTWLLFPMMMQAQMYWQRPVVNYHRHIYHAGNQNWMIDQQANGWMYFANNKGLLEYDGVYWNLYPMPHTAKLRSLKMGADNRIYVGALKEFGYFTPNKKGMLDYHSLSAKLDPLTVSNIWNIHLLQHKVYYQGDRYMFCYDKGKLISIDCNGISSSGVVNGKIYFSNYLGLSYIQGNRSIAIRNSEFLNQCNVVAYLPYQGKLMIVTQEKGIYLYDGKQFQKALSVLDVYLNKHHLSCASIHQGTLAIGTSDEGLLVVDLATQQVEKIDIENGLQNKSILSMKFDQSHNLWLGLDNGIDYVSLNTRLFFLNSKLTSIGAGYCSQYFNGKLYLGTNQGVFSTTIPRMVNTPVYLNEVTGLTGLANCIYPHDNKLFIGGRKFFAMTDGKQVKMYDKRGVWHVQAINQDANLMLVGTYWGLEVMRKKGNDWDFSNSIDGLNISAKTMFVEPESSIVWVANKSDGLWRVSLNTEFTKVLHKKCYNNAQLPKGDNVYVTRIDNHIVIASHKGLFRYNADKDNVQRDSHLEEMLDGNCAYSYLKQEGNNQLWYVANGILKCLDYKKGKKTSYWGDSMIEDFEDISQLNTHQSIIGTEDGFALIDFSKKQQVQLPLRLFIRKLYLTNGKDSVAFAKSFGQEQEPLVIHYHDNSIRIEYGCDNYDHTKAITYAYRLEGLDKDWSEYTPATSKEYTDLPEGNYTFRVKIQSDQESKDIETSITFKILPPWYRSWWAYSIYILLIVYGIYYTYHLLKRGRERLIRMKDEEMNRQKTVLEKDINQKKKLITELEEEKLRNELNYKSDELVKTTLNVVRKNEILQKIRKDAESLSRTISEGNLVNVRRGMLRLINQIDTNIEHDSDLDNFQSSFDAVHNDFLRKLGENYPQLTNKDKMLCAYIKMNLMSKEIAPLLNISVRGVEISRYRLRKKLGLDEKANLAEYLQKI